MLCQKCQRPVRPNESLDDLDPAAAKLLLDSGKEVDTLAPSIPADRLQRYQTAEQTASRTQDMSFMFLGDSQLLSSNTETATDALAANARLFEILSARSDIDHPVCTECTEILLAAYKTRLDQATKVRDTYLDHLIALQRNPPTDTQQTHATQQLLQAQTLQESAFQELLQLEKEKQGLDDVIVKLELEASKLDEEERDFWHEQNELSERRVEYENERASFEIAYQHDVEELERLTRTNVYMDALHIASSGPFATINGLRLGRCAPEHPVEWAEINAAWGYAALLLAFASEHLPCRLAGYRIQPIGSTSKIEQLDGDKVQILDLFSSGDLPLGMSTLLHRRMNAGMVAFLECLRQLCEYTQQKLPKSIPMKLPYRIKGEKIGNEKGGYHSIRLGASNDKDWTDACRYTLTCCKYLLVAISHRSLD